jgi:hypothetical protein
MSEVEENAVKISLDISGKRVEGQLLRHLSPRTFSSLVRLLPITAPSIKEDRYISILANLSLQADKYTNLVKTGDIVYRPKNRSICIFLQDTRTDERMVPIGRMENIELLRDTKGSSMVKMSSVL